jgi:hypothetical protein
VSALEAAATIIVAVSAPITLYFAWQTVRESRRARSEDERDRKLRRLLRVGELANEIANLADSGGHAQAGNAIKLLGVTLAAVGPSPDLSSARQVAETEISSDIAPLVARQARQALDEVQAALEAESGLTNHSET